jgi:alpha-tubulin suppressor-like RCC1 family protein
VWCWGANNVGQTGRGGTGTQSTPGAVGSLSFREFACGGNATTGHTIWRESASMYYAGAVYGRATVSTPAFYGLSATWSNVSAATAGGEHSCVLMQGRIYCGGVNGDGQLGLTDTTPRDALTVVGSDMDWSQVEAGNVHTCGRRGGALYCWGDNAFHQAGNAGTGDYTSPTQVGTDTSWTDVSAGVEHTCGTRGSMIYCWGSNANNRSGLGVGASAQTSPVTPVCFP